MTLFQPAMRLNDPPGVRERLHSTILSPLFQQKADHIAHCYAFFCPWRQFFYPRGSCRATEITGGIAVGISPGGLRSGPRARLNYSALRIRYVLLTQSLMLKRQMMRMRVNLVCQSERSMRIICLNTIQEKRGR